MQSLPFASAILLATASLTAQATTAYLVDSNLDQLFTVDLSTGAATFIAGTLNNGLDTPADLSWRAATNELWTIDLSGGEVGTIDVTNGTFTAVYQTNLSGWQGMAWDETSQLFFLANQNGSNYMLDPATGVTTLLGAAGFGLITALDTDASGNLFGTGVLKGPLVNRRQRVSYVWDKKAGKFVQETRTFTVPFLAHVPLWRWYPDMTVSRLQDGRYAWEHHRLGRAGLAELATIPTFDKAAIRAHILAYPNGHIQQRTYEQELRTMGDQVYVGTQTKTGQYDVFERWGWLDGDKLKACGVEVPEDREHETFFANVWVLPTGEVIKAVLQPIEGVQWPYHLYYYDKDETSIFAEGLAAIMRGDQAMLNAGVRMLLDNAAVTAGPQFEVFVPAFPANADLTSIHPFKVWPRIGGDFQYPAVRQLQFNSHMAELTQIIQLFDTNADEITANFGPTFGTAAPSGFAAVEDGALHATGDP